MQRILVELLEKELTYAEGGLPHSDLGTIGAVPSYEVVEIMLNHHRRNLNAYEQGLDTVFVY